jgi:hypothetical protein
VHVVQVGVYAKVGRSRPLNGGFAVVGYKHAVDRKRMIW